MSTGKFSANELAIGLTPRLASSLKWSSLPGEFTDKVEEVFKNQFQPEARNGDFLVDGWIYPEEVIVRVGYLEKGRLRQINFEASVDLKTSPETSPVSSVLDPIAAELDSEVELEPATGDESGDDSTYESESSGETKTMGRLMVCIDAIGSLMEEYFELDDEEEMDIPFHWRPYEFEGETVYLQHSTVNTRLEEEADRILGLLEDKLIQEGLVSEDALQNASIDNDLAFEIQKAIRSGQHKHPDDQDPETDLN